MADTTTAPTVAPGYKTSEFWIHSAVTVAGILSAGGLFGAGGTAVTVAGLIVALLSAVHYAAGRFDLKASVLAAIASPEVQGDLEKLAASNGTAAKLVQTAEQVAKVAA